MRHPDIDQTARSYHYHQTPHRTCGDGVASPGLIRELTTILLIFPCSPGLVRHSAHVTCRNYWRENVTLDPCVTVSHSLNGTNNGSYKYFVVTRKLFLLPR